jgi:hypothetical protein
VIRSVVAKLADIDVDNGVLFANSKPHYNYDEFDDDVIFITQETALARYGEFSLVSNFYIEFSLDVQMKVT